MVANQLQHLTQKPDKAHFNLLKKAKIKRVVSKGINDSTGTSTQQRMKRERQLYLNLKSNTSHHSPRNSNQSTISRSIVHSKSGRVKKNGH